MRACGRRGGGRSVYVCISGGDGVGVMLGLKGPR